MAVLQLVQRTANGFQRRVGAAFSDSCSWRRRRFHFDTLGQFNGVAPDRRPADLIQRVFPHRSAVPRRAF